MGWFNRYQEMHATVVQDESQDAEIAALKRQVKSLKSTVASFKNQNRQESLKNKDLGQRLADCETELAKARLDAKTAREAAQKQYADRVHEERIPIKALARVGCKVLIGYNEADRTKPLTDFSADDGIRCITAEIVGETQGLKPFTAKYDGTAPGSLFRWIADSLRRQGALTNEGLVADTARDSK